MVLYLTTDVASAAGGLGAADLLVSGVALALTLVGFFAPEPGEAAGVRRLLALGAGLGLALLGLVAPDAPSLPRDLGLAVGPALAGALVLDLALTVPDVPPRLRAPAARWLVAAAAAGFATVGLLAVGPAITLAGEPLLVPPSGIRAPAFFGVVALVLAQLVRALRPRLGSGPDALAGNAWGLLGLLPGSAFVLAATALLGAGWLSPRGDVFRFTASLTAVLVLVGHAATIDPRRRFSAGPSTRRAFALVVTVAAAAAVAALAAGRIDPRPETLAFGVATLAFGGLVAWRVVERLVAWAVAPDRGRLLRALEEAAARLDLARDLPGLAAAVLPPLRAASRDLAAEPILYTRMPDREVRVDAAGEPHVRKRPAPDALAAYLAARPDEVLVRSDVEPLEVRRPDLRPVIEVLVSEDAFCAVPLTLDGEVEGVLVVPRGRRRRPPRLEELYALQALARRLVGLTTVLSAEARAQERAGTLLLERDRLEERIELLLDEREKLLADARVLKAGHAEADVTPLVAYSAPMRDLERRVADVAPLEAPVLLVAEPGAGVDRVARAIHRASGRRHGGLVLGDCAAVPPDQAAATLFGEAGVRSGWLELAAGGTLLLVDVPALPLDVQRALDEAIAARRARWAGDAPGTYDLDVRLVATARTPLPVLAAARLFDEDLAQRLSALRVDVPPLRDRVEDLRSLVLLGVTRACRALGREPLGVDEAVLAALAAHDWPGNLGELQSVLDRAVLAAPGPTIEPAHLPALRGEAPAPAGASPAVPAAPPPVPPPAPAEDPLEGTYEAVEKRLLARALERAGGNKSAAARMLGLKRTTFLDKVRRYELTH